MKNFKYLKVFALAILFGPISSLHCFAVPGGFAHVEDVIPNVKLAIIFYSEHNFIGGRVDG